MKNYMQSKIWKYAFDNDNFSEHSLEREQLKLAYESMRKKARYLVSLICGEIPGLTEHNIDHLDSLWDRASLVINDSDLLNPLEAFILGGSILLHDSAMTLAAYPNGLEDIKKTLEWRDHLFVFYTENKQRDKNTLTESDYNSPSEEAIKYVVPNILRIFHAKQAKNLALCDFKDDKGKISYLIESEELRNHYGLLIGQLAESHWKYVNQLSDLKDVFSASSELPSCWTAHPRKLACILRVADAIHIDHGRTPLFLRALIKPQGVSSEHWDFQQKLMPATFDRHDKNALVFTSSTPFKLEDSNAWKLAEKTVKMIEGELAQVDQFLIEYNLPQLKALRVKGASSSLELTNHIEVQGWQPVNAELKITDTSKVIDLLGGAKLYGKVNYDAPLRELLQNACDAVKARRKIDEREADWGTVAVKVERIDDDFWLAVQDSGIGMSKRTLTSTLIDFGRSFWNSGDAQREFPGLMATNVNHTGKFGIGFFSTFMLGNTVQVISKRYDDSNNLKCLHIDKPEKGLGNIILRDATSEEAKFCRDYSTTVKIKLKVDLKQIFDLNKLPLIDALNQKLVKLAAATEVNIIGNVGDGDTQILGANDWLNLSSKEFLNKFWDYNPKTGDIANQLELIRDNDNIYGRALFLPQTKDLSLSLIKTAGGFLTSEQSHNYYGSEGFYGIIAGHTNVVARDSIENNIPKDIMSLWLSNQINIISGQLSNLTQNKNSLTDKQNKRILYKCNTVLSKFDKPNLLLPLFYSKDFGYLTLEEFKELVTSLSKNFSEIIIVESLNFDSSEHYSSSQDNLENAYIERNVFKSYVYYCTSELCDLLKTDYFYVEELANSLSTIGQCYGGEDIDVDADTYEIVKIGKSK
jgi:hypothetical protein